MYNISLGTVKNENEDLCEHQNRDNLISEQLTYHSIFETRPVSTLLWCVVWYLFKITWLFTILTQTFSLIAQKYFQTEKNTVLKKAACLNQTDIAFVSNCKTAKIYAFSSLRKVKIRKCNKFYKNTHL